MVLTDILAIAFGFGAAIFIADGIRTVGGYPQISYGHFLQQRGQELPFLMLLMIGIFGFGGLYRRSGWEIDEFRKIIGGVALIALVDAALQFTARDHISRLWFFTAYPLAAFSIISFRMLLRSQSNIVAAMTSHVVFVGSGVAPDQMIYEMRGSRAGSVKLLTAIDMQAVRRMDLGAFDAIINRHAAEQNVPLHRVQVVLAPSIAELADAQEIIAAWNQTERPYGVILPCTGLARSGLALNKVIGADMVIAEINPIAPPLIHRFAKRAFDLTATTLGLIAISPLMLTITGLLMLEGGPVLFRQKRVGRDGRRFNCYKFRSMLPDAEQRLEHLLATDPEAREEWEKHQKLTHDPRITLVGRFLRKTSMDELPQLINVLKGDMSLVGPRPIIAPEVKGYQGDREYYMSPEFSYYARCTPGITGLWQVSGRASTTHEERVRLDSWYARNMSFWLDLMILFKTFRAVVKREGST
ncbi:MAG: sugar transferase [Pseudomonadota bacterium]